MNNLSHEDFMKLYNEMKEEFRERISREDFPKKKVVINACYGGFVLSQKALDEYKKRSDRKDYYNIDRDDPVLIEIIEEMGKEADGLCSSLVVVEVPKFLKYSIDEYDGLEWVAEEHSVFE